MLQILLLILGIIFVYIKLIKLYSTWARRGIKQTKPLYLFGDNAGPILHGKSFHDTTIALYNSFPEESYFGMYQMTLPTLMIRDPELIKTLTIKDFDHFVNRRPTIPDGVAPLWSKNLVFMKDVEWKQMRMTLSPSFTSSKMKSIFNSISECCEDYVKYYQKDNLTKTVEFKDMVTRYTNDVIASVAYGIKCSSINNKDNEFFTIARDINGGSGIRLITFFAYTLFPTLCKVLKISPFPRRITKFFTNVVKDTINTREERKIVRPDMIHLLMETRKENALKSDKMKLDFSDEDIAAQAFIFYLGGFQTVTAPLSFMGHVLATHPDIQRKLQEEVDKTAKECEGKLTYEALLKMRYLDMVVSETLRKWPSLPVIDRLCTKAYTMPPSTDKGRPLHIYPGEPINIPVIALHYDSQYFPNPEKFDPERFSDENRDKINPYAYIPFGLGPRNCIGLRLALLEIKIFYFYFLLNFDFLQTEKTENPVTWNKHGFVMEAENKMWIAIKPRVK